VGRGFRIACRGTSRETRQLKSRRVPGPSVLPAGHQSGAGARLDLRLDRQLSLDAICFAARRRCVPSRLARERLLIAAGVPSQRAVMSAHRQAGHDHSPTHVKRVM
jgi:hypothetical protein